MMRDEHARLLHRLRHVPGHHAAVPLPAAVLVANDLLSPGMFDAGVWPAAMPLVAAAVVVVVARKTKSLLWCALAGCASYALLAFCFAPGVA